MNEYTDTNFTHFCEIIREDLNVSISPTTLKSWLSEQYVLSPKAKRSTKKQMKITLQQLHDSTLSKKVKNDLVLAIEQIDDISAHPRRPRCKYAGEMIQMDASEYFWINGVKWHLHVAIDDATGKIVGAYFDTQETLNAYYNVFYQILTNYGIPAMFYTDKRTVFEYKRKDTKSDSDDTFTQFSYACHQLGVQINTTSIPQAKGRVERLNQTLQSRLPVDLRRAGITSIEQANKFLTKYVLDYNSKFALHLDNTKNVYEKQPEQQIINNTLAIIDKRVIDSGHSIKYKNNYYLPINNLNQVQYFSSKTKCLVIKAFDGTLYANIGDTLFLLKKIETHEKISKEFDTTTKEKKVSKKYIPPISHPWKQQSFNRYLAKQKHREEKNSGAYV